LQADNFRILSFSTKIGICGFTASALAFYALVCNTMNDTVTAYRLNALASRMATMFKSKHAEGWQLWIDSCCITTWKDPNTILLKKMERGIQASMECGDFEIGMGIDMLMIHYEYFIGDNLASVDEKYVALKESARFYGLEDTFAMVREIHLKIQFLRDSENASFDPSTLSGLDSMDKASNFLLAYYYMTRAELGLYFGDFGYAKMMVKKLIPVSDDGTAINAFLRLYLASLIYASLALETGKTSHLRKARRFCKMLKKLCEIRGGNSWHRVLIMEAQIETAKRNPNTATIEASFEAAIQLSRLTGHVQDVGIASQLAGEYFKRKEDGARAQKYLVQARDAFHSWGALALVQHLERKHKGMISALPNPPIREYATNKMRTDSESGSESTSLAGHTISA
jgi:hypothetical protein